MKLSELLSRRAEVTTQMAAFNRELEEIDAELFTRMKSLVVAIEGSEGGEISRPWGTPSRNAPSWPVPAPKPTSARRMPRTSPLELKIVKVLSESDRSLTRNEIFDILIAQGVNIRGKNPKSNLSAHLSYSSAVIRDEEGKWMLKQKELAQIA